jgi:Domain of Unknown Function (DUF1080)
MRFEVGERVRVLAHPAQPVGEITARWAGAEAGDTYGEDIYAVSGFVTRQRESSLAREGFTVVALDGADWQIAGHGAFHQVGPGMIESDGGPGILWYPRQAWVDFALIVDWRLSAVNDNSGVFVRLPALDSGDPQRDSSDATEQGYEVQIDERGVAPEAEVTDSPWHRTGAIYRRSPAHAVVSRPVGQWNTFEIEAAGPTLRVRLNGILVSELDDAQIRRGYIGLQAHHPGSRVRFRNLQLKPL